MQEKTTDKIFKNALYFIGFIGLFILLWTVFYLVADNDWLFPSFSSVLRSSGELLKDKDFYIAYGNTLLRVLKTFLWSFVLGVITATTAYLIKPVGKILSPFIAVLRSLPTLAVALLLLIWSTPEKAPVFVGFLALFPILYTGVSNALSVVPNSLKELCKVYNVPVKKQIVKLYLPYSVPYLIEESASALSFGVKLVVSAEIICKTYQSMGELLQNYRIYEAVPKMLAVTLLTVLTGILLETLGRIVAEKTKRSGV